MVQFFQLPAPVNVGTNIGESIGQGLSRGFETSTQQQFQRSKLQEAFSKLKPGANFIEQLKTIAPDLLTTPGGAQALSELAPVLGKFAQNEALLTALNKRGPSTNQSLPQNQWVEPLEQPQAPAITIQDKYRNPRLPKSEKTTFPQRTAGPQPQREMSPQQIDDLAKDIMLQSALSGNPITYPEALNTANAQNNQIVQSNERINLQNERIKQAQSTLSQNLINRATNSGLIKTPEDRTVAEKLALQSADAETETDAWEYVRTGLRDYEAARNDLVRSYSVPGPFKTGYRKLLGSYKEKEQAIKDLQPSLDKYRKYGLFDEAKNDLVTQVGMGAEDAQSALFPLNPTTKKELDSFPKNQIKEPTRTPKTFGLGGVLGSLATSIGPLSNIELDFPGQSFVLPPEKFNEFKEKLLPILKENESINLISLRGKLNQDKRYAWQDIYKAIDELIAEGRFTPDIEQDKELKIIRNAPLPGLAQQFKYLWTETK